MFLLFFTWLSLFSFFFSRFFLYFVTKIYFSALERARIYTTNSVPLAYYFHSHRVSIVLLSQFKLTRVHTIIMTGFPFCIKSMFYLSHSKFYLETSSSCLPLRLPRCTHVRTHSHTRRTACLRTLLSQKLEITCRHTRAPTHMHRRI